MDDSEETREARLSRVIRNLAAKNITPYGSANCTYAWQRMVLATAAELLRAKGHAETADYVDAEITRIDGRPYLDTSMENYLRAMGDQLKLVGEIWGYCKQRPDLADMLPHLSLSRRAQGCSV